MTAETEMTAHPNSSFFVAGGTVPPGSPSYVERSADKELYEALSAGEYCYVLNSRQMGKSSLAVRTVTKLNEAGISTAFIDLTRIGGANVTADQWFAGLLAETGRVLGLRQEAVAFLREHKELGPAQRFLTFIHEVALTKEDSPLVVIIDEIDAVRSLGFSTDELFAGIRQLHNGRASEQGLNNLTFCMLGAALPSDLIRDPRATPFNVGRRVELRDFTLEEAGPLSIALGTHGQERLARVLYWTSGHPFLTQALCNELGQELAQPVDQLVQIRYLGGKARESDTNLTDVGNRMLGRGDPNVLAGDRADTLSLFGRLLKEGIPDDESNPSAARVKMSGIARLENGRLTVRNRIYERVFDRSWIRENMPGQELRRQRRAFMLGVFRTGAIAGAVLAVIGLLAWNNARLASIAQTQRNQARYDAYVASMETMPQKQREGNITSIDRTLKDLQNNPARGWEWDYWKYVATENAAVLAPSLPLASYSTPLAGDVIVVADADSADVFDVATKIHRLHIPLEHSIGGAWGVAYTQDGNRIFAIDQTGSVLLLLDSKTGKILANRRDLHVAIGGSGPYWDSPNDQFTLASVTDKNRKIKLCRLDLRTLEVEPVEADNSGSAWSIWFNKSGTRIAWLMTIKNVGAFISIRRADTFAEIRRIPIHVRQVDLRFEPDGTTMIVADDSTIERCNVDSGKRIWSIPIPSSGYNIELSPDGGRLLVSSGRRRAYEYDLRLKIPQLIRTIPNVYFAIYVDNGRQIAGFGDDLRLFKGQNLQPVTELKNPGGPYGPRSHGNRGWLILNALGKQIFVDRANPYAKPKVIPSEVGALQDASGRYLVSETGEGCKIHDILGRNPDLALPEPVMNYSYGYAANPSADLFAMSRDSTQIVIYDTHTGKELQTLGGIHIPYCIQFSYDGKLLAVGDMEGYVTVWRVSDWRKLGAGKLGRSNVQAIAFSGDDRRLAAGGLDGDCGIMDIRTGKCIQLQGHSQEVDAVAWSHDGTRLATGGLDLTVRVWDTATGKDLGVVGEHAVPLMGTWFTPGDRTLCSVDVNGTIKLWRTSDHL